MKKEEKCLVTNAMDKCNCEFCKQMKKFRQLNCEQIIKWEAYKIWRDAFEREIKEKQK